MTLFSKFFLAPVLALPLLGAVPATPSWVRTVTQAPNGAYVMGNPRAKVRLVEYISYTCGHCAQFVGEAKLPLKRDYVAKGRVSVEFRNAVRDRIDFAASLVARCGGSGKFFGISEQLMATQNNWLGKAQTFAAANDEKMEKMPINDGLKMIARGVGFDVMLRNQGIAPAQMDACLTNKKTQDLVAGLTNEAWQQSKINGTPAFKVNGTMLSGAGTWTVVESAIKAALAVK